jgi:protocatechuate 3,4-dioxygenase alpha subunit
MLREGVRGERIAIQGRVLDGEGEPLRDAVLELWQADAAGLHPSPHETRGRADPAFAGWGRSAADPETGLWRFETVRPGRVPWPDGRLQAPHAALWIMARGINAGLLTRIYFAEEEEANAEDPLLALVEPARRRTLLARREAGAHRLDIHLQGERETVFLDA